MVALAAIASLAFVAPVGARAAAATPGRGRPSRPGRGCHSRPGSAAPAAAATIKRFSLAGYVPNGRVAISGNVTVTGQSTAGFVAVARA